MIYSVDKCVLLDILLSDPDHGVLSKEVLKKPDKDGKLVVCPIVYTELSPQFEIQVSLDTFLKETEIKFFPFIRDVLWKGGKAWKDYILRGGKRKDRIIPESFIGTFPV